MTDAELEELERLIQRLAITPTNLPLSDWCQLSDGVLSLLSTIRTLKAEVEKRDRVVEAARAKLAAEDKVNGNIAFGVHDEDDAKAHGQATKALQSALSALDQEDTP